MREWDVWLPGSIPTCLRRDWDDVIGAEAEAVDWVRHGHSFAAFDATASHSGDVLTIERPSLARS